MHGDEMVARAGPRLGHHPGWGRLTPASGRGSSGPTGSSTVRPLLLPVEHDESGARERVGPEDFEDELARARLGEEALEEDLALGDQRQMDLAAGREQRAERVGPLDRGRLAR